MSAPQDARVPTKFRGIVLDAPLREELVTSCPIVDELFSALESFSEVKDVGIKFIQTSGKCSVPEAEIIFPKFQAYVRQAKTFFIPAETLHHRARPLFYYYAFLNLAKALLCVRNPPLFLNNDKFRHGLRESHSGAAFEAEAVVVETNGVFCELYHVVGGARLPSGTVLNIGQMLRYVSDLERDYSGVFEPTLFAPGKAVNCWDAQNKNYWALLAIFDFEHVEKLSSTAFKSFLVGYEPVTVGWQISERVFDIRGDTLDRYQFFQSRNMWTTDPEGSAKREADLKCTEHYFTSTVHPGLFTFQICTPVGTNYEFRWNELLAGYAIYFYLGSLVRYHPAYLETLLETKYSWALEAFTKSASVTLLRHFVSLVFGHNMAFSSR